MERVSFSKDHREIENLAKQVSLGTMSHFAAVEKVKSLARETLQDTWLDSPFIPLALATLGIGIVLCGSFLVKINLAWGGFVLFIVGVSWFLGQLFFLCRPTSNTFLLRKREYEKLRDQADRLEAQRELDQLCSNGYKLN